MSDPLRVFVISDDPADRDSVVRELSRVFADLQVERISQAEASAQALGKEAESGYRSLFDGIPVGLYRSTPAGRFLEVNLALVHLLGYPDRASLLATNAASLYEDPGARARWQDLMDRKGVVRDFETRLRCHDGTFIWMRESSHVVRDGSGQALHYEGTLEDITARKQAEEAFRQSEMLNRAVIEHSPVGISVRSRTGELLLGNEAWKEIWALSDQEIQELERKTAGQSFEERYPFLGGIAQDVGRVFESGGDLFVPEVECKDFRPQAAQWISLYLYALRDEQGRVEKVVTLTQDITARKQAEKALRESEEKYRTILDNIEDGYYEVDIAGNFTFFNDSMCRIIGYSRPELMGMNNRQYMDEENAQKVFQTFNRVYVTGEPARGFEWELIGKDDARKFVEVSVSLIRDASGAPIGFRGIARDITARKQAEAEIRRLKEFNEGIVQSMAEGIAVEDVAGYFTFINPAAATLLDYEPEELVGQHWTVVVPPDQQPIVQAADERRMRGEADRYELELVRKDGARVPVLVSGSPRFEEGRFAGTMAVFTDITEHKQAEEALHLYAERLRILHEIDQAILAARSPAEIVRAALERIRQLVPCQRASVSAFDLETREGMMLAALVNGGTRVGTGARRPLEEFGIPEDAWSGEVQVVEDILSFSQSSSITQALVAEGIRSFVRIPLLAHGELIGTLNLGAMESGTFAPEYVDIACEIADSLAVAIQNARLYEEVRARSRYLETLQQVNATLRSTLPLDKVLKTIVHGTGETLGYVGALITVPDAMQERLIPGAVWGRRFLDAALKLTGVDVASFSLPLAAEENPMARAYLTGELQAWSRAPDRIVVGVEPAISPRLAPIIERAMGARLAACVPLPAGQEVVGVLVVFSPREQLPNEERAMLLGLAAQAGLAIENARLYGDLQNQMVELKHAQAQLIQSAKMAAIGHLAAGVAHELNNPLTSVLGFAELLLRKAPPEDPNQVKLAIIAAEARRARDIVRGLLDFARQTEFHREWADVNQVVRDTLALSRRRLEREGIAVEERYAPGLPISLLDIGRMKQVFLNLVTNALDSMPQGGTLTVTTEQVGDEVTVRFTDTGAGIPAQILPRIFEPFFTTKPVGQGTGLGLSISLGIVEQHGGRIEVESEAGEGSIFTIWLPAGTAVEK